MSKVEVDIADVKTYEIFSELFPDDFSDIDTDAMEQKSKEFLEKSKKKYENLNSEIQKEQIPTEVADKINDALESEDTEKINDAYDTLLNCASEATKQLTDEEVNSIAETLANGKEAQELKEISEKIEAGELSLEGEDIIADVNVNPISGERQIVSAESEFKEDKITLDEVIENPDFDHANIEIDDDVFENSVKDKLGNSFTDLKDDIAISNLVDLVKKYKNKEISAGEAFLQLPESIKSKFNEEAAKSGIPVNNISSYRKAFVKEIFDDIINTSEFKQTSVDFDKQIAKIYKEYGNDISVLYQSGIFEKIKTLKQTVKDIEASDKENKDQKIEEYNKIIDNLYESVYLENFAKYAIKAKIKPFELEKPQKLFRDFIGKYANSKFAISDITSIFIPLIRYCEYTEDEAIQLGILFCKYTKGMRPSNLGDHTFMYYFISNIIFLNSYGAVESEDEKKEDDFCTILKDNLKKINELRRNKLSGAEINDIQYTPSKISDEYIEKTILKAEEKAKELEEENNEDSATKESKINPSEIIE